MNSENFFDQVFEDGTEICGWEIRREGREEAITALARHAILRILLRRFGTEADRASDRIETVTDLHELEVLIEEAAVAPELDGFLRQIPSEPGGVAVRVRWDGSEEKGVRAEERIDGRVILEELEALIDEAVAAPAARSLFGWRHR